MSTRSKRNPGLKRYSTESKKRLIHQIRSQRLEPNGVNRKVHEFLIEHLNATGDAFHTHITSKDVNYTISSELVPNTTMNQNIKIYSQEQQVRITHYTFQRTTSKPSQSV